MEVPLGRSCMVVPLLLAWSLIMLAPVLLILFEASPLIYLLFRGIFSHPAWPDPLGRPSPGAKTPLLDLLFAIFLSQGFLIRTLQTIDLGRWLFATIFANEFYLMACIILCSFY